MSTEIAEVVNVVVGRGRGTQPTMCKEYTNKTTLETRQTRKHAHPTERASSGHDDDDDEKEARRDESRVRAPPGAATTTTNSSSSNENERTARSSRTRAHERASERVSDREQTIALIRTTASLVAVELQFLNEQATMLT